MTHSSGPFQPVSRGWPKRAPTQADDDPDTDVLPRLDPALLAEMDAAADPKSGRFPAVGPPSGRIPAVPIPGATDFDEQADDAPGEGGVVERSGGHRSNRRRSLRRRVRKTVGLFAVMLFCVGALGFAGVKLLHWQGPGKDYSGPPGPIVVIEVNQGDTADQIAQTMLAKGVVASTSVFYKAAIHNSGMSALQPGYYALASHTTGAAAVLALMSNGSRVGNLVLSEGRQLMDSHDANTGAPKLGIYSKIAAASCYGPAGQQHCISAADLQTAGASTDLAGLGVPAWATTEVSQAPDRARQLEGLIASGTWDFDPTATPTAILRQLVSGSAAKYEATGLIATAATVNQTPYRMLIAASLVEREALPQDMAKVARVIFNRLAINQPLEFDSTVNYDLDATAVATTDDARAKSTPWNTYAKSDLPATPISSPSIDALKAVEAPTPGPWLYFVTVNSSGTTLFTADYQEHLKNIKLAEESGILDSGRQCPQSGCPR